VNHLQQLPLFLPEPFLSFRTHTNLSQDTFYFTSLDTVATEIIQNGVETKQVKCRAPMQSPSPTPLSFFYAAKRDPDKVPAKEINGTQMPIEQIKFHAYIENH
jgi:hypothetical protein